MSENKPTVLVVDDDPAVRRVMGRLVERTGCRADLAEGGREAIEMAARGDYDVILLDGSMPDVDGFDVTRAIRTVQTTRRTPIVGLTGENDAMTRARCLEAGMDDHLSKPITLDELRDALATYVRSVTARDALDPPAARYRALLDAASGDAAVLAELVDVFLRDARQRIDILARALEADDHEGRRRAAHRLKGSAAMVGAKRAARLAALLEEVPASPEVARIFGELRAELDRTEPELRALRVA